MLTEDTIRRIEQVYHSQYDPNHGLDGCFDARDQLLACEAVAQGTPLRDNYHQKKEGSVNENTSVNGDVFDSYKRNASFELTESKRQIITQLEVCTYRTPPIKVAAFLEEFFREWPSCSGYWLSVTQKYPPRPIVRVIKVIVRQHIAGFTTVRNPAKLFSFLIHNRSERKRR